MSALKNVLFRKEKRDRNFAWRKVCNAWYEIRSVSTWDSPDCNPWKEWCKSWEEFCSSEKKPPKAERAKADMFSELFCIAQVTGDKLEEAKIMRTDLDRRINENIILTNQNVVLQKRCEELQRQLDAEKQMIIIKNQHQTELQHQMDCLMFKVQQKNKELQKVQDKCRELEKKCSSFEGQLVEFSKKNSLQIKFKNDIIVFPDYKWSKLAEDPKLQYREEERSLDLDSIRDIADRLGKVTRCNVFDWLCSFEVEYNCGTWTRKDFEQILRRCMDSSSFSSLPLHLMIGGTDWVYTLKQIAERFIPDVDNLLATENMRENDTALQYFHRMWMIYRIAKFPSVPTKNDEEYINATMQGLPQHLFEVIEDDLLDYEVIEHDVLSAEYSWAVKEDEQQLWHMKTMKAGAGCPSRYKIWKRLEKYWDFVPYETINGAPFWDLVVILSRFEDLRTGEPRKLQTA